jgi:phosphoribosyl-ATP pyrophosphohydrolase
MSDSLDRLYAAVVAARDLDPATSRTARLLRSGQAKMSKKLAEEAIEVVIDAMNGEASAVVRESADLIYNLAVLWVACGVKPRDVWAEMDRREKMLGIAEKLPKAQRKAVRNGSARSGTVDLHGVIALRSRRASKRR